MILTAVLTLAIPIAADAAIRHVVAILVPARPMIALRNIIALPPLLIAAICILRAKHIEGASLHQYQKAAVWKRAAFLFGTCCILPECSKNPHLSMGYT